MSLWIHVDWLKFAKRVYEKWNRLGDGIVSGSAETVGACKALL